MDGAPPNTSIWWLRRLESMNLSEAIADEHVRVLGRRLPARKSPSFRAACRCARAPEWTSGTIRMQGAEHLLHTIGRSLISKSMGISPSRTRRPVALKPRWAFAHAVIVSGVRLSAKACDAQPLSTQRLSKLGVGL